MYNAIASNKRKTVFILFGFLVLIAALAILIGQIYSESAMYSVLIFGVVYAAISYYAGSKWSLALNKSHEIQKSDNPRLWRTVENLAITEGLPMPKVYIMDDPALNAFATGRDPNHAAVSVTSGLLEVMSDTELEGVLAHELGHIKNYDIRVSMIAFALAAIIAILADFMLRAFWFRDRDSDNNNNQVFVILGIAAAIIAPLIALLIQMAISRKREYLADATGALTTRYPEGLASALEKIGTKGGALKVQNTSTAHFFFANPLKRGSISGLFSTHPPIEDRVARLRHMETNA